MAVDDKILKMLAIMEDDSATDAEKEAAAGRIQHLATMNSIDLEKLRFARDNRLNTERVITRAVEVGEPGREHKNRFWVDLFNAIGHVNDLRMTMSGDNSKIFAYGYPTDIDFTEVLFKSLATQMVMSCDAALKRGDHKEAGVHGKTYRPNFYEAYVRRIGARLYRAKAEALEDQRKRDREIQDRVAAVIGDAGDPVKTESAGTDLVLATKKEKVDEFYNEQIKDKKLGKYRQYGAGRKSTVAQRHGDAAAQSAVLGATTELAGSKKELT